MKYPALSRQGQFGDSSFLCPRKKVYRLTTYTVVHAVVFLRRHDGRGVKLNVYWSIIPQLLLVKTSEHSRTSIFIISSLKFVQ